MKIVSEFSFVSENGENLCVYKNYAFGEVEGEGGLISSEIVNVEDELVRQIFFTSPNDPTDACVHKSILVSTNVDALHKWQAKVPCKLWIYKWCDEATTRCIHMNWSIPSATISTVHSSIQVQDELEYHNFVLKAATDGSKMFPNISEDFNLCTKTRL